MKQIRRDLKLTQQDLALLLQVSRTTIAMIEKGLRPIPMSAVEKWIRIKNLWERQLQLSPLAMAAKGFEPAQQQMHAMSILNAHLQRAAAQSIQLTQLLSNMERRHEKLHQKLNLIRKLMDDTPPGSKQLQLLQNREQLTLIQISECCPERRQLLSFKLQVLASQQKAALAGRVMVQQQR